MKRTENLVIQIRLMGCTAHFIPYWDSESRTILLEVRNPAKIVEGRLVGSQIDVYDKSTFRAWTPRKTKANAYSARYNLVIRNLDGECELFVPANKADEILPQFGAKVKKAASVADKAHLKRIGFKKHTLE